MSLTNLTTKTPYAGNGVTTVFPFTFKIFTAQDIVVTETTLGVPTTLVLNTDYTVTGVGLDAGGSITRIGASSPPATGTTGLIRRVLALTQSTDIRNQSAFYAATHEDVFDRLTMIDQQEEEEIGRCLQIPEQYSTGVSNQLPQPLASTVLGWNASANAIVNMLVAGVTPTYPAANVSFTQTGTGAVASIVDTKLKQSAPTPQDYGATGNGSTDDTTAVAAWLTANAGKLIYAPPGTYLTAPFTVADGTRIIGAGMRNTTFKMKSASNANLLMHSGASGSNVVIENLTLDGNSSGNTSGRMLSFTTNAASDGPGLTLKNVVLTGGPTGSGDSSSAFVSGLAWVIFDNVRFINNNGSLWLSTNDSEFNALYIGNSGVVANVPGVVLGGSSNKFISAYFGGNGAATSSTASQVQVLGGQSNQFISCTNDSANGHGYEFLDSGANYAIYNQIIGGTITNPSQNTTNTYNHVYYHGHSTQNTLVGVGIYNTLAKIGKYGVAEAENAGNNQTLGCYFGSFGTGASSLLANGSQILFSPGVSPAGSVNSFNGRSGAVVPAANDYTFAQLAATQYLSTTRSTPASQDQYLAMIGGLAYDFRIGRLANSDTLFFARWNGSAQVSLATLDTSGNWAPVGYTGQNVGGAVASAATITPTGPVFHVTGTTAIATINLPYTGFTGSIRIIPDGLFTTGTGGNIALASTAVVSKVLEMTYDGSKWFPSY